MKEEIEKKVAAHQKQLEYKYGLANHSEDSSHKEGRKETILVNLQESVNEAIMTVKAHSVNHQVGIGKRVEVMIHIPREKERDHDRDAETKTGTAAEDELTVQVPLFCCKQQQHVDNDDGSPKMFPALCWAFWKSALKKWIHPLVHVRGMISGSYLV
nr:CID domain-containing protein [Tanacetum cinerariifolium]